MHFRPAIGDMDPDAKKLLAPTGVLRAGINMSNFLLVSQGMRDGIPVGISPDMAAAVAETLGLRISYVPYANPGLVADAAVQDEWDIALVGAEPQRAEVMAFTPAYSEIEATYLVPAGSPLRRIEDVDASGIRIAVAERTAYGLWLERNIRHAELVLANGMDGSLQTFRDHRLDALAGLLPRLISDVRTMPGARLLEGRFMTVQQAIGVPRSKVAAIDWLNKFVDAAREQGFVAQLIKKFSVEGLSVA